MKEQRKYIRYDLEGWARLKFEAEGTVDIKRVDDLSHVIRADLQDISYGGISVWAGEKMESGANVLFELTTKFWDDPISGKGKVRYAREMRRLGEHKIRVGIEFLEVNREIVKDILNRILEDICQAARKSEQSKKNF